MKTLDLVIPVFNEERVLPILFERLETVFSPIALSACEIAACRFIFVDDGSSDSTAALITSWIRSGRKNAALLRLSRNFGHQSAVSAGIGQSKAEVVGIIDADLQDPPGVLLEMLKFLNQGYDVVYGERRKRKASLFKRSCYWFFYRFLRLISDVPVPVDAGDFCVMNRRVVDALLSLPEKLRFVRGLRSWVGFRQAGYPYSRPDRAAGDSKYTMKMLYQLATDGVASLSIRPLRLTQAALFFSLFILVMLVLGGLILFFQMGDSSYQSVWFLLAYLLIGFTSSLQIFCLYIIGAYLGRTYLEVKDRPTYVVMEVIDG